MAKTKNHFISPGCPSKFLQCTIVVINTFHFICLFAFCCSGSTRGFDLVAVLDLVYMSLASSCLMIQQLQFLQVLRFNKTMALLPFTLSHAARSLMDFCWVFCVLAGKEYYCRGLGVCVEVVAHWKLAGLQVNKLNDWFYTWGPGIY